MPQPRKKVYPKNSAGRLMNTQVPVVSVHATVGDIQKILSEQATSFDTINYIYLTDAQRILKGVVSIRELFGVPGNTPARTLSSKPVVTAHAYTDQERVVLLALKHGIKAVPVVDKQGSFLGVVPSDTILNVLHSENIEDVLRFAGAGTFDNPARDIMSTSVITHFRKRILWLIVGLVGGMVAAGVVSIFESSFAEQLVLVAFIPAVVYMADAVGSQTQMIFVRSMAVDHAFAMRSYIWREIRINLLLSSVLGVLMFLLSYLWLGLPTVSIILGISIALTIVVSMMIAIGLPWILQKCKQDPAIASGPPATVSRDILSLVIYFLVIAALV